jgi:hypothetical protein
MSVESYDTLASDDELNTTSGGLWSESANRGASVEREYDEYTAKLEADIDYWTSLAAKYEEDPTLNFAWTPKPQREICAYDKGIIMLKHEEYVAEGDLKSAQELHAQFPWLELYLNPISQYDKEVIRLDYNAQDIETRLELLKEHVWLEAYLNKFEADCAVAEELADKAEEKKTTAQKRKIELHTIGVPHRITGYGREWFSRKDRKKKYVHKTTDAAGRVKEAPKCANKKPYQDWRKKKVGREHTPPLVPRKRNEYFHELHDCLGLPYPDPKRYEQDLYVDWEEASVAFWEHKRPVFTWYGVKRILF